MYLFFPFIELIQFIELFERTDSIQKAVNHAAVVKRPNVALALLKPKIERVDWIQNAEKNAAVVKRPNHSLGLLQPKIERIDPIQKAVSHAAVVKRSNATLGLVQPMDVEVETVVLTPAFSKKRKMVKTSSGFFEVKRMKF